ncbi:MAG TPA: RDD family protein [Nocardioides sp.]|uniref:RDD family protein n=1 Tax=Nocardioides sp. TaxID=35761 RepID=UPI002F3E97B7
MSHAGPPPEPPHDPDQNAGDGDQPGRPDQPYNPYPDNWQSPGGSTPPQNPYGQPSPYGQSNPYGQPDPYAAPGQPGSPANPYAGPVTNKPTFGFGGYAGWFSRVGAYLIDGILGALAALPLWVGYVMVFSDATTTTDANGVKHLHAHPTATTTTLIWVGVLTSLAFQIWNLYIRQGRTGATIGKSVLAIRLVNADLQPIGPGWAFLRQLLHIVDSLPCGIGWLWPIWDSRKQTFADKIMNTFVIQATTPQPRPF